jgi:hypothetical protein
MSSTLQLGKSLLEHKFLVQPTRISMISVPNLQTHTGFGQQKYKHQMHKTKGGTQLNLHHFFFFGYRYLHILLKGKIAANSCLPKTQISNPIQVKRKTTLHILISYFTNG